MRRTLLIVAAMHFIALYVVTQTHLVRLVTPDDVPLAVSLLATPQPEPDLPQPQRRTSPRSHKLPTPPVTIRASHSDQPTAAAAAAPLQLFNRDGSVRLPDAPDDPSRPFDADVAKGRELMGRGLDCEKPDALSTHESLGEEVARKYLSWIGMYNSFSAERRAELRDEKIARCARWKAQS